MVLAAREDYINVFLAHLLPKLTNMQRKKVLVDPATGKNQLITG
jgi:hypothetical protein